MSAERDALEVDLPSGRAAFGVVRSRPQVPWASLVLAHGAGAGLEHPFLAGFADALTDAGVAVTRFNFPYREAGRRMPGPAAHAIATWRIVAAEAASRDRELPLWAAGKSYGGRMASMAVADEGLDVAGLVYLGYPLHPPGKPEKLRAEHLPRIGAPQLFVEGENDPFIQPREQFDEVIATCRDATVEWISGGGHSFEVRGRKRPAEEIGAGLAPVVAAFLRAHR